jgi:hypothetical protein
MLREHLIASLCEFAESVHGPDRTGALRTVWTTADSNSWSNHPVPSTVVFRWYIIIVTGKCIPVKKML